ncbi:MBL fold metallo-hydrolase [Brevibacillus reuszeri]|uniref:MBL fold metallo-hydrolase n=1 Tax=Brevibacillus reuszeri TaxID=54915 RepID=UPI000CCC8046|nr:MBL fold metallo-hydrolase [Brevibacillus reuszeri]
MNLLKYVNGMLINHQMMSVIRRTLHTSTIALLLVTVLLSGCSNSNLGTDSVNAQGAITEQANGSTTAQAAAPEPVSTDQPTNKEEAKTTSVASPLPLKEGKVVVHYIDVGQGASQLIIGPSGKTILIDAGNNDKEKVVTDYLKKQGVKKIDILLGTHPDADHTGGLDAVIRTFDIGKIYMPRVQANTKTFESVLTEIAKKGLKVSTAKAGLTLEWEPDVTIKMIAPIGTYPDANDMSAVIQLTYGTTSFLFTGDAEVESEKDMVQSQVNLNSDVLLVGHHGSKTSTSEAFLNRVNPTYAIIQSGKENKYGHPTNVVLDRLAKKGIKIYRNDEQGNIVFSSNGKEIIPSVTEWKPSTKSAVPVQPVSKPIEVSPSQATTEQKETVYYKNCAEAKAAGAAPLRKGDPGYRAALDRDNDGIACEK